MYACGVSIMKRSIFSIAPFAVAAVIAAVANPAFPQADNGPGAKTPASVDEGGLEGEKKPSGSSIVSAPPSVFQITGKSEAPSFKKYVFWAYGFVCFFLFLFYTLCILQSRKLEKRVNYLQERFEDACAAKEAPEETGKAAAGPPAAPLQ